MDNPEMVKNPGKLFELVRKLEGTISGEQGIGLIEKIFLDIAFDNKQLNRMKNIKKILDPNNILNAGKIFDIQ